MPPIGTAEPAQRTKEAVRGRTGNEKPSRAHNDTYIHASRYSCSEPCDFYVTNIKRIEGCRHYILWHIMPKSLSVVVVVIVFLFTAAVKYFEITHRSFLKNA